MMIKTLFLAGFILAFALASKNKPSPAALLVKSNFDFSLTHKEFRVHYAGFESTESVKVFIKIHSPSGTEVVKYEVKDQDKKERKAFQFALDNVEDGKYTVEVCADDDCSERTPSLTDVVKTETITVSCKQGKMVGGMWKPDSAQPNLSLEFKGPSIDDWSTETDYTDFEGKINNIRQKFNLPEDFKSDYNKHDLKANPTFKKGTGGRGIFHASFKYDLSQFKQFFVNQHNAQKHQSTERYSHDICERKHFLSAHAHLVNDKTHEVEHRFKTTLFLSEGGKQMFVLGKAGEKVLVEITHEDALIPNGEYKLWISLCTTDKDENEKTFCADPLIKDLTVKD